MTEILQKEQKTSKKSKKILITIISVIIVILALGGVGYYHFFLRQKPPQRQFVGGFGDRNFNGNPGDICERIKNGDLDQPVRQGTDIDPEMQAQMEERFKKIEEYCADGQIDDEEMKELESNRPEGGFITRGGEMGAPPDRGSFEAGMPTP